MLTIPIAELLTFTWLIRYVNLFCRRVQRLWVKRLKTWARGGGKVETTVEEVLGARWAGFEFGVRVFVEGEAGERKSGEKVYYNEASNKREKLWCSATQRPRGWF